MCKAASLYDFESIRSNSIDNAGACLRTFAKRKLDSGYFKNIEVYCVPNHENRSALQHKVLRTRVLLDHDVKAVQD